MGQFDDPRAAANRIRVAVSSLTDARDLEVVREYLTELEMLAALQDADYARPKIGARGRMWS